MRNEQQQVTVGCAIAAFLEQCGVKAAFGVISIHNMPILDAMGERGKIRFVPARGEAGGERHGAFRRLILMGDFHCTKGGVNRRNVSVLRRYGGDNFPQCRVVP